MSYNCDFNDTEAAELFELIDEQLAKSDPVSTLQVAVDTELQRQKGWAFRGRNGATTGYFFTTSEAEALGAAFGTVIYGPMRAWEEHS